MKILRQILTTATIAVMCTVQSPAAKLVEAPLKGGSDSLVFVYVHGFGGVKESPKFCENLQEFLLEEKVSSEVVNYEWDSVKVDPLHVGASWIKSQKMAHAEAPRFRSEVLEKLERDERSYVIVAFSVGSRVALQSLESTKSELKGLRGVYFLGSAMTKDTTLKNRKALPKGMKITNYHSPTRDLVHRMAFNFMSETPPGGQVGFDDRKVFENYPVSCAHAHKRVGFATDYSSLAEAIAFLELYEQGVTISGSTMMNWKMPVVKGEMWWNKIRTLSLRNGTVELEQHLMRPGYYRAVSIEKNGKRKRIARGENLHAILQELGVQDAPALLACGGPNAR